MTERPCRACGARAHDTVICWDCAKRVHQLLHDLADDIVELTTQLTRQARAARGLGRSATTPLPYDERAGRVLDDVRSVLVGWTKVACETEGDWPPDTLAGMLRRLRRTAWATHPAADELLDELTWTHRQVLDVIETAAPRRYLGPCGAARIGDDGVETTCPGDVVAIGSRDPRCRDCRAVHDAAERIDWLASIADGLLVNAADAAAALTAWRVPVKAQAIYDWARRGRLLPHGHDRNGHPVYVLAEVRALAVEANARTAQRQTGSNRRADRSHSPGAGASGIGVVTPV